MCQARFARDEHRKARVDLTITSSRLGHPVSWCVYLFGYLLCSFFLSVPLEVRSIAPHAMEKDSQFSGNCRPGLFSS